jgi:hypothetical protein
MARKVWDGLRTPKKRRITRSIIKLPLVFGIYSNKGSLSIVGVTSKM